MYAGRTRGEGDCVIRRLLLVVATMGVMVASLAAPALAGASPLVVIVMENKSYATIVGSSRAPFINQTMIGGGRLLTQYNANSAPSVTDYLAMTSGLTDKVATHSSNNIFNQLQTAGTSWAEYEESMPSACYTGTGYGTIPGSTDLLYNSSHNPAYWYSDIKKKAAVCQAHVLPYSSFSPTSMPAFSFVVPNQCNDMHTNCGTNPVATGDSWLAANVPAMVVNGATVVLTWDEGGSTTNRHVATVLYGAGVSAGAKDATSYTHFNLLAGLEQRFGQPLLNGAIGQTPVPIP